MTKRIIFLTNGWDSAAGGIQTVNRELVSAMAKLNPDLTCTVIVPTASDREKEDAFSRGVNLIAGYRPDEWSSVLLSSPVRDIPADDVVAVVGHSYFTGREAIDLRDNLFPGAVLVQFVHTSPLHIENLKEYRHDSYVKEREVKVGREVDLAVSADLVICIGPRLHRSTHDLVVSRTADGAKVRAINCGVARLQASIRTPPIRPTLLCVGRTESIGVKGLDIFAYTAGYLAADWPAHPSTRDRPAPQFIIRGVKGDGEDFERRLLALAQEVGGRPTLIARPYTTDLADLTADYRGATAFLMPSREEGFGLVACEALSHGVPTLVSENSGIAEVIRGVAAEHFMDVTDCVVSMNGDAKEIARRFADVALRILIHEERVSNFFNALAERLITVSSWEAGAEQLYSAIEESLAAKPNPSTESGGSNVPELGAEAGDVLAANKGRLSELPGLLTMSVQPAIVLTFEKGRIPADLPTELFGVPVTAKEGEAIQQTAAVGDSDGMLLVGGARRGSFTPIPIQIDGRQCVLTAAHVIGSQGDRISIQVDGRPYQARLELVDEGADWAVLSIFGAPRLHASIAIADPHHGQPVRVALSGDDGEGVVVTTDVTAKVTGEWDLPKTYDGLFELIVLRRLPPGISGGPIVSEQGETIGMVIASARGDDGEPSRVFGSPLRPILHSISAQLASRAASRARRPVQGKVGIIPTDELSLLELLRRLEAVRTFHRADRRYFKGMLGDGSEIVVCPVPMIGNIGAASATVALLLDHEIDHLFVVGLCGGLRRYEQNLADVVISSDVLYYEPGVIRTSGNRRRVRISGSTPHFMLMIARDLARDPHGAVPIHIGSLASGEKIIQAESFAMELKEGFNDVIAVDMESAGVFEAARSVDQDIAVTVVRGIADFADEMKNDAWHQHAAHNAAMAAVELVQRRGPRPSGRAKHSSAVRDQN